MRSLCSLGRIVLATLFLFVAGIQAASATHFRYGTLSWEQDVSYNGDPNKVRVVVTFENAWRWSHDWEQAATPPQPGTLLNDPDFFLSYQGFGGTFSGSQPFSLLVETVSAELDMMTGTAFITLDIPTDELPLAVWFSGCCRDESLADANDVRPYEIGTVIDTNNATRSPRAIAPPIVYLPMNQPTSLQLPSAAYGGLTNLYSWASTSDSWLVTPRPNGTGCWGGCPDPTSTSDIYAFSMTLSNAGVALWTPSVAGRYAAQFSITSVDGFATPKASVPLDLIFEVVDPGFTAPPPAFDAAPPSLSVQAGNPVSFPVSATALFPTQAVALEPIWLPGGTFQQTDNPLGQTGHGQFSWTPTGADAGSNYVCLRARDWIGGAVNYGIWCAQIDVQSTPCAVGTYSATGQQPCTPAPAGHYVDVIGATSATPCVAGTYNSSIGANSSSACIPAPAGSYATGPGAIAATPCAPGSFSSAAGSVSCTLAPAGSYATGPGATSATPCPVGKFSSSAGSAACTDAPAGTYVSAPGSTSPTPCPPGTYSSAVGATSSATCAQAPAGSYATGPGATSATLCAPGSFSATAGAVSCALAPAGSYVAGPGATSATSCAVGTFSSTAGAAACAPAPAGYYVGGTGATAPTACSPGSFSSGTGASSCTLAPAGSYATGPAATSAPPCAVGTFSSTEGAVACTPAPAGYYVDVTGAIAPTACAPGSFSSGTGASSCTLAPAGSYATGPGATSATVCPVGTFSSTAGAAACTPAPAGYYVDVMGAIAPTACPTGTTSAAGATSCTAILQFLEQRIVEYLGDTNDARKLINDAEAIASARTAKKKTAALATFTHDVDALRGTRLTGPQADYLIALAQMLFDLP